MKLDLSEYLDDFLQDARELLQNLDETLLALEKNPKNQKNIDVLFRIAHTLKGSSSLMGFHDIKDYTHVLESVIELLRSGKWSMRQDVFDLLFSSFGFLRETISILEKEGREDSEKIKQRAAELTTLIKAGLPEKSSSSPAPGSSGEAVEVEGKQKDVAQEEASGRRVSKKKSSKQKQEVPDIQLGDTIRVDVKKLDLLLSNLGELVLNRTRTLEILERARHRDVGENQHTALELRECLNEEGRIIGQIQESIMKARMLPVEHLFELCPRIVRDISRKLGKKVKLEISGSATELDKKMIDVLSKPFIHLLTNAVSHGIETPKVRSSLGKPSEGRIKMSAFNQHGQVVVTIEDDGAGIDFEAIAMKLKEHGMDASTDVENLCPRELFEILALPGLSLADEVTDVSGRGVGLDAVKSGIEAVNGTIEVHSKSGAGTKFTIRLPLTLVIIPALLVGFKKTTFAVPMAHVSEIIKKGEAICRDIPFGGEVAEIRGDVLPVVKLDQLMEFSDKGEAHCPFLLISGMEGDRIVIPIHELKGEKEIVVKNLSPIAGANTYLSGASILGSGEVALVLDIFSLLKCKTGSSRAFSASRT